MSKVSIPKGKTDPSYRYQRFLMTISTYGQGGNLKTRIDNVHEVSKQLAVPSEYPLKFLGYELGSQTDIKNGEYIISGKHTLEKLEELLEKFIKMYVLCSNKKCQLPETTIFIKNNQIRSKCRACSTISSLDDKHGIANYIIKSPPSNTITGMTGVQINSDNTTTSNVTPTTSSTATVPDKKLDIKKVKSLIKKLNELIDKNSAEEVESLIKEVDSDNTVNSPDCKYFIILHGLYGKDIYEKFESRMNFLKNAIANDQQSTSDEISFHIATALINLFIDKYAKDKEILAELSTKIPSVLYLFYNEQIFTEAFLIKRFRKQSLIYKNIFAESNSERAFIEKSEEFLNWLDTAGYEGEEVSKESNVKSGTNNAIDDL